MKTKAMSLTICGNVVGEAGKFRPHITVSTPDGVTTELISDLLFDDLGTAVAEMEKEIAALLADLAKTGELKVIDYQTGDTPMGALH